MNIIQRFFIKRLIKSKFKLEYQGLVTNVRVLYDKNQKDFAVTYDILKNVNKPRDDENIINNDDNDLIEEEINENKIL